MEVVCEQNQGQEQPDFYSRDLQHHFRSSSYKGHVACFTCSVKKLEDDFQDLTMNSARSAASRTKQTNKPVISLILPVSLTMSAPVNTRQDQNIVSIQKQEYKNMNSLNTENDLSTLLSSQNPSWLDCWQSNSVSNCKC